jgi:hypothetical protein
MLKVGYFIKILKRFMMLGANKDSGDVEAGLDSTLKDVLLSKHASMATNAKPYTSSSANAPASSWCAVVSCSGDCKGGSCVKIAGAVTLLLVCATVGAYVFSS